MRNQSLFRQCGIYKNWHNFAVSQVRKQPTCGIPLESSWQRLQINCEYAHAIHHHPLTSPVFPRIKFVVQLVDHFLYADLTKLKKNSVVHQKPNGKQKTCSALVAHIESLPRPKRPAGTSPPPSWLGPLPIRGEAFVTLLWYKMRRDRVTHTDFHSPQHPPDKLTTSTKE